MTRPSFLRQLRLFSTETDADKNLKEILQKQEREQRKSITNINIAQKYITDNVKRFDWYTYVIGFYIPGHVRNDFYTLYWFNKELFKIASATKELS